MVRRSGPLLRAKFHPHQCKDEGIGPPKLKCLLIFDQNVEYKRPAKAYRLHDFHKIYRICTSLQDALAIKVSLDLLKGLWGYGSFNSTGSGYPKIYSAPGGETMRQTPNVLEVQERARGPLSPYQVWCVSDFTRRQGGEKTLSFLSVRHAFFVRHAFKRQRLFARFRHEGVGEHK